MAERGGGFWAGFLTGLAVAALAGVVLALAFRLPADPPEIAPAALLAPPSPEAPAEPAGPEAPGQGGLLGPAAVAPLIGGSEAAEDAPASPSLVPLD